mmetsp:Transcript_29075/g.43941  ORF Transcript_29075/g.43941 Transcript_29075/m.43941 type:complete len:150 (+) Transcript_29075:101-550(+)
MSDNIGKRLEEAANRTIKLMEKFSERDPSDTDSSNPWKNPQRIFEELDKSRSEIIDIWKSRYKDNDATEENDECSDLQSMYLEMITEAFSDSLDEMRMNDEIDVSILVDCLQSGMDFFTEDQIALFVFNSENDDDLALTPHERRRRELI